MRKIRERRCRKKYEKSGADGEKGKSERMMTSNRNMNIPREPRIEASEENKNKKNEARKNYKKPRKKERESSHSLCLLTRTDRFGCAKCYARNNFRRILSVSPTFAPPSPRITPPGWKHLLSLPLFKNPLSSAPYP